MSNRRTPTLATVTEAAACPDCDSDVQVAEVTPGVFTGRVVHDDSCPWLAAFKERAVKYGTPHQLRLAQYEKGTKP
jgi:hypothetical protein